MLRTSEKAAVVHGLHVPDGTSPEYHDPSARQDRIPMHRGGPLHGHDGKSRLSSKGSTRQGLIDGSPW